MPFEEYSKLVFEAEWFRADGQIVALDGDRWVGMAAVALNQRDGYSFMYNNITGVDREYRGRGIAQALKVLAVRCARKYGARHIRTNNHSTNAPMLAVNRKMGYRPEPGQYLLVQELS